MTPKKKILLIDNQANSRLRISAILERLGAEVCPVVDLESAWREIGCGQAFAAIVCDRSLPDGAGLNFTHWLRRELITTPVVLLQELHDPPTRQNAYFASIPKPVDPAELSRALGRFLQAEYVEEEPAAA